MSILILTIAGGATGGTAKAQALADGQTGWDRAAAAQYLDDRINLWFERATDLKTGEGTTSCISCHSAVPYLLARPALRKAMQIIEPTPQEIRLLKERAQRVDTYPGHQPLSDSKHGGEHGTEAVFNALILARQDAHEKRAQPSELTRKAFRQLWDTQGPDGAWDWMDFVEEPDESADARYYGAALAALAVGTVRGLLDGGELDPPGYVDKLRAYLTGGFAEQNLYRRTWMLLASTRLAGLLDRKQREVVIAELRGKQDSDGGWSLHKLGPWRWSRTTPPFAPQGKPDTSLLEKSDGYATGLIAYVLRQTGLPASDPALKSALEWLKANQKVIRLDQHNWKCWRAHSLNHDRENGGARGGAWKQMLMSDTATAFAVLALSPLD